MTVCAYLPVSVTLFIVDLFHVVFGGGTGEEGQVVEYNLYCIFISSASSSNSTFLFIGPVPR